MFLWAPIGELMSLGAAYWTLTDFRVFSRFLVKQIVIKSEKCIEYGK